MYKVLKNLQQTSIFPARNLVASVVISHSRRGSPDGHGQWSDGFYYLRGSMDHGSHNGGGDRGSNSSDNWGGCIDNAFYYLRGSKDGLGNWGRGKYLWGNYTGNGCWGNYLGSNHTWGNYLG